MKRIKVILLGVISLMMMANCVSSVSTQTVKKEGMSNEEKGRAILDKTWRAQGFDKLNDHKVYEVQGVDHWKGMLGRMGKVWPEMEQKVNLKYDIGSFDGQVELLDGKDEGFQAGLQSWNYYEGYKNEFEFKEKADARLQFGLAAYQYFFELSDRLRNAPLVTYAGETEFEGKTFELVLATWDKLKAHKAHDQYTLWINKETGIMEFAEYTVHDSYLPGGSLLPASIEFADFRNIEGVMIPFTHSVFAGSPKENRNKYLHRLTVESFSFDSFNQDLLYPNKEIKKGSDSKEVLSEI